MSNFNGSLDANAILRILVKDIPEQYEIAKQLLEQATGQFAVSDTAIIEVAFVLHRAYGLSHQEVKEALEGFMSFPQINCNRMLFDKALVLYASSQSLSMEDCAIVTYAELNNALPLYTFDRKLANAAEHAQLL